MENQEEQAPKKKRGRPRSFAENSTVKLTITIQESQKKWLDEQAGASPQESASNIVRQALDLWYEVNIAKTKVVGAPQLAPSWRDDDDSFDYSWQ